MVGTVPVWEGKVLLCKRNIEPRQGFWTLPAGFMELNETTEQGAVRETVEEAGARTLEFIRAHVPKARTVPLAGNSIGTDRRFLAAHLPEIEEYLHYRSVDVSTIKELAGRWYPEALAAAPRKAGGHRAMDDIKESLAELAYYRNAVFRETTTP